MTLENFDSAAFLRDTWQQKPLLIRQGLPHWQNPIEPDELAGLAGEEGVEARLVTGAPGEWALEQGPISGDRFGTLGEQGWTLLVQAVDHHVPEVAELLEAFRFIPDWRIDDVMVSYAADGGGVGPHFDQYDVFLVQGLGRRRWRIGAPCDESTPLLPHEDLRLLAGFEATDEWVLEPGDILYLPPGVAHDGVALDGDCMTYSIGFRAPSRHELIAQWTDEVLDGLSDDDRYTDPGLPAQSNPGEITPGALARLHAMATDALLDPARFAQWFGRHTTEPKYAEIDWAPEEPVTADEVGEQLARGASIERNSASRFAFVAGAEGTVTLFVDGEAYECSGAVAAFATALCPQARVNPDPALGSSMDACALVMALVNTGSLAFAED